ncbi:YjbF family lipoprotein [Pseudidiomarina donghaiensis]|uniref:YjbF family lipoprotein n=1 Tax=Pseudidiomarina donghaiensis TaxID=519452 RepID=UPI003A97D80E
MTLHTSYRMSALFVLALTLTGCAQQQDQQQPAQQQAQQQEQEGFLGQPAEESLKLLFSSQEDYTVTPEQARALPYAANYARVGEGVRGLVVLGENDNVVHNGNVLGLRQQWFTGAKEVVETYNGRVISLQNLNTAQVKHLWITRVTDANSQDTSGQKTGGQNTEYHEYHEYHIDARVPSPYHTAHKPHYMTKRHSYKVTTLNAGETEQLTLPNGRSINATIVRELLSQNGEPQASNEFFSDPATGRIVHSKQWLGPELGYFEFTEVQPYNGGAGNMQNWAFSPVGIESGTEQEFQQLTTTDGSNPLQYVEVRVVNASSNGAAQQTRKHTGLFYANSRLNQAVTEYHRNGVQQPYYEPLTRLSSAKLEQQFAARKQGMATKLALLAQTYKHDGNEELAKHASALATSFNHWPLKASYIHGMSLANARLDLAQNPVLNTADASISSSHIPYYELRLNQAPLGPQATQEVGLTYLNPEYVYVVDAFGVITQVPMQHYNSNAAQRAIAEQPGAVVLYSINDNDLPKGFRDINLQLAQFLQHWQFSVHWQGNTSNDAKAQ